MLVVGQLYIVSAMTAETSYEQDQSPAPGAAAADPQPEGSVSVPDGSTAPAVATTEQQSPAQAPLPPEPNPNAQGAESAQWMVSAGSVDAADIDLAANLSRDEAVELHGAVRNQLIPKEQVRELLSLPPAERTKKIQDVVTEKLISSGIFEETDRENLLEQPADELLYYLEELSPEDETEAAELAAYHPSDTEVPSVKAIRNSDMKSESEEINRAVAKRMLEWTGRGGVIDQAIGEIEKVAILQELDAALDTEAEAFWADRANQSDAVLRLKLDGLSDESQKEAFLAAYKAQKLLDPEYLEQREAYIVAEAQRRADVIRGIAREGRKNDGSSVETPDEANEFLDKLEKMTPGVVSFLKTTLLEMGEEAAASLADNDFGQLMRLLLLTSNSYGHDRGGHYGHESNAGNVLGKEYLLDAAKKPKDFGEALAHAYENDDFIRAGFKVNGELLQKAKDGDQAAIREVMQSFLKDLFNGAETSDVLALRWKVAKTVLPEMIYPGKTVSFDDKTREYLEEMHESIGINDGAFDKTFPSVETAAASGDTESEPGKTAANKQPIPFPAAAPTNVQPLPRAA